MSHINVQSPDAKHLDPVGGESQSLKESEAGRPSKALVYRPEIDGLRTIAVLSVFVFHLDHSILESGFIGVDIFFVLSGFLITSILLFDIDQGKFSVARFYQRRIARIAPAFLLVLVTSLAAAYYVYSPQDFSRLGTSSIAAVLSVINLTLLKQGGYFEISADAQPLLHYWSLAVEEQFYLVFPFLLYFIVTYSRRPLTLILGLLVLSYVGCVVLTLVKPNFAFYLLPTRAWELLAGSALAVMYRQGITLNSTVASLSGWLGFGILVAGFALISEGDGFPGWIAALPVLGTVLVLANIEFAKTNILRTVLAFPLFVFIGKHSYSLYLWHWPVFSLVDYHYYDESFTYRLALKVVICTVATMLTYKFVECPARDFLNQKGKKAVAFATFGAAVICISVFGWNIRGSYFFNVDVDDIADGGVFIENQGKGKVVLVGDSLARVWFEELTELSRVHGFDMNIVANYGTNNLPGESDTRWPAVKEYLLRSNPDVVIVVQSWSSKLSKAPNSLRDALATIDKAAKHAIVIAQPPVLPEYVTREAIRRGAKPPFFEEQDLRQKRLDATSELRAFAQADVTVLEIDDLFEAEDGSISLTNPNGRFVYQDRAHLTKRGTARVRARLEEMLLNALAASRTARQN